MLEYRSLTELVRTKNYPVDCGICLGRKGFRNHLSKDTAMSVMTWPTRVLCVCLCVMAAPVGQSLAQPPLPEMRPSRMAVLPLPRPESLASLENVVLRRMYGRAFQAAKSGAWSTLDRIQRPEPDPVLEDVLAWLRHTHTRSDSSFQDIARFAEQHSDWPNRARLLAHAEKAMTDLLPPGEVIGWFAKTPPRTVDGHDRLIRALRAEGRLLEMRTAIRQAWRSASFTRKQERAFLASHGHELTAEHHWQRLDRLLWKASYREARRMLPKVSKGQSRLAEARMGLRRSVGNVDTLIKRVPASLSDHPGLLYERIRWRHRKGKEAAARELFWRIPTHDDNERLWWRERSIQIRNALDEKAHNDAYLLATSHNQSAGAPFADAEWHAGWIALRFAKKPEEALHAFVNLFRNVSTPISLARAAYWAGRAAEAVGDAPLADTWFIEGARYPTTFYGQLAAAKRPGGGLSLPEEPTAPKSRDSLKDWSLGEAATALIRAGQRELARDFLLHMARVADSGEAAARVGRLAAKFGYTDLGVHAARRAARNGHILIEIGYPVRAFNRSDGLEDALALAVIRQESAFGTDAKSHVGARGLMQLMPATAKQVARQVGVRYSRAKLTADPEYNVLLGRRYLKDLIDQFDGSYVMAIAAYNAGPARAKRWARQYGDPRDPSVDVVDWIERIPFNETRNYVQRVLEGLQVYRLRLGEQATASARTGGPSPRDIWCVTKCGVQIDALQAYAPPNR